MDQDLCPYCTDTRATGQELYEHITRAHPNMARVILCGGCWLPGILGWPDHDCERVLVSHCRGRDHAPGHYGDPAWRYHTELLRVRAAQLRV